MVAVLSQPAPIEPRRSTYPQWAKSDLVRHNIKALHLNRKTTTSRITKPGPIRPTPSRSTASPPSSRTTKTSTSLLPWMGIDPSPNQSVKHLEKKLRCGSDEAENLAFEKKCRKYFNPTVKSDPLEFVFRFHCFTTFTM